MGFFLAHRKTNIVLTSSQIIFLMIGCIATLAIFLLISLEKIKLQGDVETDSPKKEYYARPVISHFEIKMFERLKKAFPDHHVLTQVAFSALVTSNYMATRNKFNRKVTDFVILNHHLDVVCIIELDDPTHAGKEKEDAKRDAMLEEAGYTVLRYTKIPSVRQLQKDIN